MAAKYAILELPNTVVLPLADALKLFELLADAEQVEYDYTDYSHKPTKFRRDPSLKHMTIAQYAAMQLKAAD